MYPGDKASFEANILSSYSWRVQCLSLLSIDTVFIFPLLHRKFTKSESTKIFFEEPRWHKTTRELEAAYFL